MVHVGWSLRSEGILKVEMGERPFQVEKQHGLTQKADTWAKVPTFCTVKYLKRDIRK